MSAGPRAAEWHGPVFVVGFPRSGTTLLQQILNGHPDIAVAPETHFIGRYWRHRHRRGPLADDAVWEMLLREIAAEPGFLESGVDGDHVLAAGTTVARGWPGALEAAMRAFAEARSARIFGEKTPLHQLHMPQLQQWFPEARFIHIVRDPRAAVSSWRHVPWSRGSVVRDAMEWDRRDRAARADAAIIREILTLRYEDLVRAPEPTVRTLCSFLGVEPAATMLSRREAVGVSTGREPWKQEAAGPVNPDRVEAWRSELGRLRILAVEVVTRSGLRRYGYEPSYGAAVRALAAPSIRAFAGAAELWHQRIRPFLFPGPAGESPVTVLTDAFRDSANPYGRLLADAVRTADPAFRFHEFRPRSVFARNRPGLWHMQWPASRAAAVRASRALFDVGAVVVAALVCRLRGIPMVWTVHNLAPHEERHAWLSSAFMQWLTPRLSGWVSLSEAGVGLAIDRYPALRGVPHIVVRHGHYGSVYPDPPLMDEARRSLGIAADRVLLALGTIRPYKRYPALARAFTESDPEDWALVIAGSPRDPATVRELQAAAEGVDLRVGQVAEDQVPAYFAAATGFVLPADRILNSGSALLALTFGVPVLVPDTPVMAELRDEIGPDAVVLRSGGLSAETLEAFLASSVCVDRVAVARRIRAIHAWPPIGRALAELYRDVFGDRTGCAEAGRPDQQMSPFHAD